MYKQLYAVVDVLEGYIAICEDYQKAYDMATKYVDLNTPYETLEECEDVWIDDIELNEFLI